MSVRPRHLTPDKSARHLFGAEMRRLREAAGMTLEALGEIVRYSKSSLHRFEFAESVLPPDLPGKLDAAFGTDGLFVRLYALAKKEIHPDQFRRMMNFEAQARLIQQYTGQIMPGIVQTRAYSRALFEVYNPKATVYEIDELVAARMSRQELLSADSPPDLSLILDEAVIRRSFGGPAVMRGQLQRLLDLTLTPTTVVQIIPFEHGGHALVGGSLRLMTMEDGSQVVYEESISTGTLLEDQEVVAARRRDYDLLTAHALSPEQTAAFIRSALEALA
ncbi:helix-turn-helix domain-containing protein [Streptomyces buecherae]|uniref:Helix-turn-helix domain-containing protein n=1 Tax=Streptomyces buecherae TaxID=2763006 RepID=A0A7H8N963_9ACTN|nr:helix-turn-helix transcriptional regulator [Streptomyces buecherae]QKW50991.1 helix-turn-helix domain-containing protein [Streptomyces buecherae]